MNNFCLNDRWRVLGEEDESENAYVDFPYDALVFRERDYSKASGFRNGFYRSETFEVEKKIEFPKAEKLFLEIEGAMQFADVFVGESCVATITNPCKYTIDVSDYAGGKHTVALKFVSAQHASRYTGLGISGGIKFVQADSPIYIDNDGVTVTTAQLENKTELLCRVDVVNDDAAAKKFTAAVQIKNARGRRVTKKTHKFRIAANSRKSFYVPLRLARRYEWSRADAYLYCAQVSLILDEKTLDCTETSFGVRTAVLDKSGFMLSGRKTPLCGACLSHDCGAVGRCSVPPAEMRKASAVKASGFNAVRFVGVPSEAALDALDKTGLMCIADLFDCLGQPKETGDGHEFFGHDFKRIIESSVKTLRKHPCVIAYGIADCPPESYGRGRGAMLAREIAESIRVYDDTRFTVAAATELIPSADEMIKLGVRADKVRAAKDDGTLLSLSREKNVFRDLTADWFAAADVAGYSNLYQRYQSDLLAGDLKILGTASRPDRVFETAEETERNGVIGDFVRPAVDMLGSAEKGDGFGGKRCTDNGDLDLTLKRRPRSIYREICRGAKNLSVIVIPDPEDESGETETKDGWNLPRFLGKPVTVKVYTGGDVVALYLDGKLVGRKLAGKMNRHIATFRINYYPGRLEAVSFRKGAECCRCFTETASSPKNIKLFCEDKNVSLGGGNMAFVEISVTDKEGRPVTRAQREVEVTVSGDGMLYALTNADPYLSSPASVKMLPVYEGRAFAAVRGTREGKMTVKVSGEGLSSGKITVKVKP